MQHASNRVHGLSDPREFKDNCGFGLIAHTEGHHSHQIISTAFVFTLSNLHIKI